MEFYHVTVDFMTTSYVLNIKLSGIFNTLVFFSRLGIFTKRYKGSISLSLFMSDMITQTNSYL